MTSRPGQELPVADGAARQAARVNSSECAARLRTVVRARLTAGGERGEAIIEFIAVTVVVVALLAQLIVALARIEAAAFATEAAAREVTRLAVGGADAAQAVAPMAVELAFADQGLDPDRAELDLYCLERCGQLGERVRVQVRYRLDLPGIGAFLPPRADVPFEATYEVTLGELVAP